MSKAAVVYWSGSGNTQSMAEAISDGIKENMEVDLFEVSAFDSASLDDYERFAFGCPAMGSEVLEESEFEPFYSSIEDKLSGKKVALFGSYDWGDCTWMRDWEERLTSKGGTLFEEGLTVNNTPDDDALNDCKEFGKRFSTF